MRKILLSLLFLIAVHCFSFGQTIFTQNFEATWTIPSSLSPAWSGTTTPADNQWQRDDYTTGWTSATGAYTPAGANSTLHSARFHTYDAATATTGDFITPVINLSAYTAGVVVVKFYYINTSGTDVLNIYSSNDGGTTWSAALRAPLGVSAAWTEYTTTLPGNSATTKIKLTATSDYGVTDIGVDEFRVLNPIIPAPPINFTTSVVTQSSMTVGWTDNSNNEVGFRVYKSTDQVTYTQVGTDITSTSVATTGTLYSQPVTGLIAGVTYYYKVVAYADAESAYLTGSQTTLPPTPRCGNKTVGPTGDYASLTAAFADLAANGISCPVNLILQSTYVSTVETFPVTVNPIPGTSASQKVTVYPSATGLSVTSGNATGTLNLANCSYVVFDGRVNASGTTKDLVIENTNTTGYAVQFVNGASYNSFQYCIIKGASTSLANGTITFVGTTGATGNNNNLVDNCEIRNSLTYPVYAIYSSGSTTPSAYNSNNTISNCLIHDFYASAGGNPIGVGLFAGSTGWTISGNSFYMTTVQSPTVAVGYNVIFIAAGDGYNIINNYIGGSAPNCGGTAWTLSGNGTPPTIANFIYAIRFQTGVLTINPSTIQGNTVANILLYTNPNAASISFTGLLSVAGIQNISNNTIGSATGTGSISISVGNGAFASTYEGIDFRGMYGNVTNNTFGSFSITGAAGSTSTYTLTLRPISVTPSVQNGIASVSGNLIGSLTTANSIQTPAMTNPPVQLQAFFISSIGSGSMSVANNTVANINNLSSYNGSHIVGIYSAGTGLPNVLSGNTIRDLNTSSTNTTIAGIASLVGIYSLNSVPGSIIRSNLIYNLTNTDAAAAAGINGIYTGHTAGNLLIEKNFIHNIGMATASATAQVTGLYLTNGGTYVTVKNNMVQLGVNPDGSANTSSCIINGIYESSATVDSILNNSVYIGGAPAAVTTGNTYAFNSVLTPSLSTPRVCMNNIFYNARSGGLTGKHYGIKIAGTTIFPLGVTSNYNLIIANGATGGTFGSFNAIDQPVFASYKNATNTEMASGNADPNFVAPNGNTATANLHVQSPTPIEAAGKALTNVTDDFDGAARSGLTPTDVGADAGNFTLSADVFGPNISYVPMGNGTTANRVLTNWATITDNVGVSIGANLPRIYFKKSTDADAFVGNTSADNGWKYVTASNTTSPFSFTINYGIINTGSVVAGDIIQYFVVAQDAANNLSSNYLMAGASANPPVQNINARPANFQTYTIVTGSIPTTITVPGTYATLTNTGGAFDMINQGVLVGNTTINITADLVEPGTIALNAWAEDVPGANYTLTIKPDATTLRTISGTAVTSATAMIRTNGASRFTIDGQAGKSLTFRNTNATAGNTGPTIQFNNGSQSCYLKNCTIENNGTTTTLGTVNIGATGVNIVEINGNNIGDATGGTTGVQTTGIYNSSFLNSLRVINNNIYNFKNYGLYFTTVADGAVITGNSFYYNSATASTAAQYGVYLIGSTNNHTISNNYFGGQAPLCAGLPWTNTSTNAIYGCYLTVGVATPTTISGNTIQNFSLTNAGAANLYGINFTAGVLNILNNTIGSTTVPGSITGGGNAGYLYGIYGALSATAASSIQGNIISGINYNNTAFTGALYFMGFTGTGAWVKVGNVTPNIIGSNTVAGSITFAGTGSLWGIYCTATNPGNAIENNIFGNWTMTAATGSPYARGMYVYSANVKKNKIFNITCTNAGATPYIYGIYNYGVSGVTNEYSNNLISLDGGAATNPIIYGFYDGSYSTSFYNLYYNDFYVSGPATTTSNTYAFYRSVAAFYTLSDNIFANNRVAGGTGKHYAAYISSTGTWSSNYNDLYSASGMLGYYNAADQATMAAWKTATGGDANSQNVDPQFVSATDLHTAKVELNNAGTTVAAVTTDYAGVTRATTPDIGAYEFTVAPVVVTNAATGVTNTSGVINGTITANNEVVITSFDYGLTIAYGSNVAAVPSTVTGVAPTAITATITGLSSCQTIHYRARGMVGGTPYLGSDMTFTALCPPTIVTTSATAVTTTTATLNGTVNANGFATTVSFDYGLTVAYGTNVPGVPVTISGSTVQTSLANITGLVPNTLYHFRINGTSVGGTINGNDMTFTTTAAAPTVITTAATLIGTTNATVNGTINANNSSTAVFFDYGLTVAYGTTVGGLPSPVTGVTNQNVSAVLSGLITATTYHYRVRGVNGGGTTNGNDMTFLTGCPAVSAAGAITGPASVCANSTGNVYAVGLITNATSYSWTLPAGAIITAGSGTNTITVTFGTTSGNITVAGVGICMTGTASTYAVTVNALPVPTIAGPASVCVNSTNNVYTTEAGMTGYNWTVSAGGNIVSGGATNSITVTWTTTGAKTVTASYTNANNCTAAAPSSYPVTVNALPVPTLTGTASLCQGTSGVVYTTQAGMTNYVWTVSAGGIVTAGGNATSNTVTITWNNSGTNAVTVNYTNANGCTASTAASFTVTVNPSPVPTIGSNNAPCVGSTDNMYYTDGGMTNYVWTISPGGTIASGQGTSAINVTWTGVGAQWVSVNYTNATLCTGMIPSVYNLFVNPLPNAAGAITGTATLCAGTNGVAYSCADILNATSFTWTLPAGATIATGAGTRNITVNFGPTAVSGNITVAGTNSCGNGPASPAFAVTVNPLPAAAGTVTGPAAVCAGSTGVAYSVPTIANAASYVWTVPAGATITSGATTKSIVVTFGPTAGTGVVNVKGTNTCGNGTVSADLNVTINAIPATPVVTANGNVLTSSATSGNQWYYAGNPIAGATGQTYTVTSNTGYYWCVVTTNGCSSPISNKVWIVVTGQIELQASNFNVYPVPNDGRFTVSIASPVQETFTIEIYNQLGAKIYELGDVQVNGTFEKQIDLRPIANGIYSVIFLNSEHKIVKKVLINK